MRKHLSKWHRRFGIFAALIAIYLSLTGLVLNHSHDLGLDAARLTNSLLLEMYGIKAPEGSSLEIEKHTISQLGEALFLDGQLIGQSTSPLSGAGVLGQLLVIGLEDSMLLLSAEGELIEKQTVNSGLPGQINRLAVINGKVLINSGQQVYRSDEQLLGWQAVDQTLSQADWLVPRPIAPEAAARLMPLLPAYGPSWERVLQDLHSGRFFRLPGTLLVDLTGISLLLLSFSGIVSFSLRKKAIRKSSKRKRPIED